MEKRQAASTSKSVTAVIMWLEPESDSMSSFTSSGLGSHLRRFFKSLFPEILQRFIRTRELIRKSA